MLCLKQTVGSSGKKKKKLFLTLLIMRFLLDYGTVTLIQVKKENIMTGQL